MNRALLRRYRPTPVLGPSVSWRIGGFRIGPSSTGSLNTVGFITWIGSGGDDNWSTTGNWGGATPTNGDTLTFAGSTRLAPVNNIVGLTLVGLTISATASSFNITGNSISMSPGAVTVLSSSAQTIALPLSITGTTPFTITPATMYSGVISGTGALTKAGAGILTLGGANTYAGITTISAGTLRLGSSSAMPGNALVLSGTGILDLNSFMSSVPNITSSSSTSSITNNATGTGTGTLNLTSHTTAVSSLITDGATAKVMFRVSNVNASTNFTPVTNANTFSGGLTLAHNGSGGTRLRISSAPTMVGTPGAITSGPWGTGVITLGEAATDQAGVLIDPASGITIMNAVTFNTALGTDRVGVRLDATGNVFSGIMTANLAAATFCAGPSSAGSASITGRITGSLGLVLNNSGGSGSVTITLANVGTANDYSGDTTLVDGTSTLVLGAANQIPSGAGKGNVTVTAGAFNLGGFSEQINGLSGSGAVDGTSGTPTLTLGDNNATSSFAGIIRNTAGTLAVTKIGSGTQTLSGASTYTGATTVSAGTLVYQNTYASSSHVITSSAVLELNVASGSRDGAATTFSGGGTLRKTGAGAILWPSASATFALSSGGLIDVVAGTFTGGNFGNEVWTSNLSGLTVATGATFDGIEANVRVAGVSGAGSLLTGFSGAGYVECTIGVDNGSGTFSGVIANSVNPGNLVKTGTGTQTLSGASTYTGTTTVSGGTLSVTGSLSASSAVTVSGGALNGTGTVGAVTVANVASSAILGGTGTTGTLTTGALTFNGATAKLRVNTNGTATVSVVAAAAVTLGSVTVDFNSAQNLAAGTYNVITGTSMTGTATQGTLPISRTWTSLTIVGNNLVAVLA